MVDHSGADLMNGDINRIVSNLNFAKKFQTPDIQESNLVGAV
jgi:hypothetical protein